MSEPSDPALGHAPGSRSYRHALLALFAIGLSTFAMLYAVQPLLAQIALAFDVDATRASLLISVTTFAIALFVLPLARLSERVGRGRLITGCLLLAAAAGAASAAAPTFSLMLALRGAQGAVLAGVPAAALAWVAEEIRVAAIVRVAGLYIAGTTVGGMSGRLLAGFASEVVGWRWAIVVVNVLCVVLTVAALVALPAASEARRRQRAAEAEAAAAPANHAPGNPTTSIAPPRPDDGSSAARRRTRLRLYGLGAVGMAMFVGLYNVISFRTALPPYLLGAGLGSMFYLTYLAGTLTSAVAGRLGGLVGLRGAVQIGLALCVLGVALTIPEPMVLIWVGLACVAGGFFVVHALASSTSAGLSDRPSDGSGRYTLAYYAGSSVGGVILGQAWDLAAWPGTAVAAFVLIACAFLLTIGLPSRRQRSSARSAA